MSIAGTWDVTINTPMGAQAITLEFVDEQSGVARRGSDSVELQDVSVSGDTVTCSVALIQPIRITAQCTLQIDGDSLTGTARAGFFGTFALTGKRTS
jgi:hypothetical protein